jgi:lipopolysaccharide transport system ATP-binding protein
VSKILKKTVDFKNVSKRYRLGLTRTSLPSLITEQSKKLLSGTYKNNSKDKYLWALRDISFDLSEGESLALVGPNGAGKTTILKLLANITNPTTGEIYVNGKLSALIELGAGFHPDLTGRENIFLNGTILGLKKNEICKRFEEIVSFSELDQFIDTPVKRYSSGMTIRLGFAVAACIEPDILLVDEVLAVGDAAFREKCMKRIQTLLRNGTSLIFVSHNLWLVQAICKTAIFLDRGMIKQTGITTDVIDMYDRTINKQRAEKFREKHITSNESGSDLEVLKVDVIGNNDKNQSDFHNDQPAEVMVNYVAQKQIARVNLVVRILRSDGLTCCMLRTSLDNYPISLEPGEGYISVTLDPLQLYGGTYYVQAIFRDASDSYGIASGWSDWFYVSGSVLSHQEMNGVFEPRRKWRHYKELSPFLKEHNSM